MTITGIKACIIDVYDTILTVDFPGRREALGRLAGVSPGLIGAEFARLEPELNRGVVTSAYPIERAMRLEGLSPSPARVAGLAAEYLEASFGYVTVYEDTVPFLRALRARGIRVAILSNCSENTRPMLELLGIAELADCLVLSCEVGYAKPEAEVYQLALDGLGVTAGESVFVDDQAGFCAGAVAVGVYAAQIRRRVGPGHLPGPAAEGIPVVTGLAGLGAAFPELALP